MNDFRRVSLGCQALHFAGVSARFGGVLRGVPAERLERSLTSMSFTPRGIV